MSSRAFDEGQMICRMLCRPIHTGIGDVVVRPISHDDAALVEAFIDGLSARSRYHRFFAPLKVLSPRTLRQFTITDPPARVTLVGVAQAEGRPCIVGEVRYASNEPGGGADIAVIVADAWQRGGIGTALMQMLEGVATAAGIAPSPVKAWRTTPPSGCLRGVADTRSVRIRPTVASWSLRSSSTRPSPRNRPRYRRDDGWPATSTITPPNDRKEEPCPERKPRCRLPSGRTRSGAHRGRSDIRNTKGHPSRRPSTRMKSMIGRNRAWRLATPLLLAGALAGGEAALSTMDAHAQVWAPPPPPRICNTICHHERWQQKRRDANRWVPKPNPPGQKRK